MKEVAYTSEFVCNNLARRFITDMGERASKENAVRFMEDFLLPLQFKLFNTRRLPRGTIRQESNKLHRRLLQTPEVLGAKLVDLTPSKLSANEQLHIAYLIATGSSDGEWLKLDATEVMLTRKEIRSTVAPVDLKLHRHAIARFMHREMVGPDELLKRLEKALYPSVVLGLAAYDSEQSDDIAIPCGDGMFFGNTRIEPDVNLMRLVCNPTDPNYWFEARANIAGDHRLVVRLMTYVDHNSMSNPREELRDLINAFIDKHSAVLKTVFEASCFEFGTMDDLDPDNLDKAFKAAWEDAKKVVKSPEWEYFVQARREFAARH